MISNAGQMASAPTGDTHESVPSADDHGQAGLLAAPNRSRPQKDRWMSELIRRASAREPRADPAPTATLAPPANGLPAGLNERLRQAVRWGFQERDFTEFETSLMRPATPGELFSWARQQCGCSLEELGRRADVSAEEIEGLEKGTIPPVEMAPDKVARLATELDVSIWTVMERVAPAANGTKPAVAPPETTAADPSTVWSTRGLRARASFEPVSMRNGDPATPASRTATYRQALYQAWRRQQRG